MPVVLALGIFLWAFILFSEKPNDTITLQPDLTHEIDH